MMKQVNEVIDEIRKLVFNTTSISEVDTDLLLFDSNDIRILLEEYDRTKLELDELKKLLEKQKG